jgi:nitroreductase
MSAPTAPGAGILRSLIARATLAPSTRNAQPWRWTVHADRVDLELDEAVAHRLEANDPLGRELVISCGAALLTLRVAAAEALFDARVEVLPDPSRPALLAAVTMEPGAIDATFSELDAVVPLRHTAWSGFDDRPLPAGLADRLSAEAQVEGARLHEIADGDRQALAELVGHADRARHEDPERRAELAEWIGSRWAEAGRIVPAAAVVPTRTVVRHLDLGDRIAHHDAVLLDDAPYVGVLATPGDDPADWLAAGQALQRVLLVAAADQVLGGFLNSPCQVDEDRGRLRDLLPGRPCPQVVLRLGYPLSRPTGTPRRPVDDVVTMRDGSREPSRGEARPGVERAAGADYTEDTLG